LSQEQVPAAYAVARDAYRERGAAAALLVKAGLPRPTK
jgi:hypothetical protein